MPHDTLLLTVTACFFKRNDKSVEEPGVMINGDKLIIDANGVPVPAPLWSYRDVMEQGHVVFHL